MIEQLLAELDEHARILGAEMEVHGSAQDGNWKPGSDLDITMFMPRRDPAVKRRLHSLLWELNEKYGARLEEAPFIHPFMLFIDSPAKRILHDMGEYIGERIFRPFDSLPMRLLQRLKPIAPRQGTLKPLMDRRLWLV